MRRFKVAVLGCRDRGPVIAKAYQAHPGTEVVALCDLLPDRLNRAGDELGVSARFTDLDEMIVATEPDIVVIGTGTELHYELSMRALEHGVSIDVEKPMCVDLEQADAMVAKANEKGARIAVHHQSSVGSNMRAIVAALEEGRIGQLRYVYAGSQGYYGGYGLLNVGGHLLSDMLKVTGNARSVVASVLTDGRPITPEDVLPTPTGMGTIAGEEIVATLQFDDSLFATLLQHRLPSVKREGHMLEFCGTEGRLQWNNGAWWLPQADYVPSGDHGRWELLPPIYPPHYDPSMGPLASEDWYVEEFVSALSEDHDHPCSGDEGRHELEIALGIFESAAYGRRVELPQLRRDHPLLRWRRENGLGDPAPMPRPYYEWLEVEDRRLGRDTEALRALGTYEGLL